MKARWSNGRRGKGCKKERDKLASEDGDGRKEEQVRRAKERRLLAHRLMDSGANLTVRGSGHVGLFFFGGRQREPASSNHPNEPPPRVTAKSR